MNLTFEERRLIELYRQINDVAKENIFLIAESSAKRASALAKDEQDYSSNIIEFAGRKVKES